MSRNIAPATEAPVNARHKKLRLDPTLVAFHHFDHPIDQRILQRMRDESEVEQMLMFGVVVMRLHLSTRICEVLDHGLQAMRAAGSADAVRELVDTKLLRELVENPEFASNRRIENGEFDATHRVADVEEATGLTSTPVHGERVPMRGLRAKAIECRAPDVVVVEAGAQV